MTTGTVKFFNATKGFGFIRPDDGSKDVFMHITAVERSGLGNVNERQRLSYDLDRGAHAMEVWEGEGGSMPDRPTPRALRRGVSG